jgi:predicted acyl esterase
LEPGEIVPLDIEIWPTSMVFRKGHRLRLDIQPRDGLGAGAFTHYHADYNQGQNTIHAGGAFDSYLLVPIIPPQSP